MIADLLAGLGRANLALAAGVGLALVLRAPLRRLAGPRAAYALWATPLVAALATLLPASVASGPVAEMAAAPMVLVAEAAPAATHAPILPPLLLGLWLAGVAASIALLALRQVRFLAAPDGPAVVGALKPRIVTPGDFETRFSAEERAVILAHEEAHLAGQDARFNALAAAGLCLCWFNPAAHLAVRLMRIDQELACDAAVLAKRPTERRLYAELLLKTQLAARPVPLGCQWPAGSDHPLKARIMMLQRPLPSLPRRVAGTALVAAVTAGLSTLAWAAQAGRLPVPAPATSSSDIAPDAKPTVTRPLWLEKPTPADMARLYPAAHPGASADVTLTCRIGGDGRFESCAVATARAYGPGPLGRDADMDFGTATLQLAQKFRMAWQDDKGVPTAGGVIALPVRWVATSKATPSAITQPDWAALPTAADLARFYPPGAAATHTQADGLMTCSVDREGRLVSCQVDRVTIRSDEITTDGHGQVTSPTDQKTIAAAMLELSKTFQMKPMTRDGHPVAGGKVRIPIRFALPQ